MSHCHPLVDLPGGLGQKLPRGDAADVRASHVRKQKTTNPMPRIWMCSGQVRDLRQLVVHRHKLAM